MKNSKSILLVLVIIFFTVTLIIPFLTGKSLGSIIEPFTSTGGLYNIKVGTDPSYCVFKESKYQGSLVGNGLTIEKCKGGTGQYAADPRNAEWKINQAPNAPGMSNIQVGNNSDYCLFKESQDGGSLIGNGLTIGKCEGGTGYAADPRNAEWKIYPIPTKHPPSHSQAMGYSETELPNQISNALPVRPVKVTSDLHREEGKRNPNGDDCRNLGLTHCMTNSNCDNDSYCAKKCVEGTCDGKSMHHRDKHKHKHKLGPGGTQHLLGPGGTQHLLGPGGTQHPKHHKARHKAHHKAHHSGHHVPDNMQDHKYKKFISDGLDHNSLNREKYERIGKNFMKDEARSKGVNMPPIHDSEAEILGKMVWRVYAAEMEEKRTRSQKAKDSVMDKEIQLLSKVSQIMKNETDHHKGKKHQGLGCQASDVPNNSPKYYYSQRTDNMFGYSPSNANDVKREEGHAFEGHPVTGMPRYFDQTNAIEHCFRDHRCGGVNYDSTTGEYSIMPQHAKLVKRHHYTAFIKKDKQQCKSQNKQRNKQHPGVPNSPYQPVTGIGTPRDPNLLPRAYNSLMDLF